MKQALNPEIVCGKGFFYSNGTCVDFDECKKKSSTKISEGYVTCSQGAYCQNYVGGYACLCKPGFESTEGTQCVDIDECVEQNVCQSNSECQNSQGNYSCNCF